MQAPRDVAYRLPACDITYKVCVESLGSYEVAYATGGDSGGDKTTKARMISLRRFKDLLYVSRKALYAIKIICNGFVALYTFQIHLLLKLATSALSVTTTEYNLCEFSP